MGVVNMEGDPVVGTNAQSCRDLAHFRSWQCRVERVVNRLVKAYAMYGYS